MRGLSRGAGRSMRVAACSLPPASMPDPGGVATLVPCGCKGGSCKASRMLSRQPESPAIPHLQHLLPMGRAVHPDKQTPVQLPGSYP
jgi:hypothetical protein